MCKFQLSSFNSLGGDRGRSKGKRTDGRTDGRTANGIT